MNGEKLSSNLKIFLDHLDSLKDTLPMVMLLIDPYRKKAGNDLRSFFENNVKEIENEDGEKSITIKYEERTLYDRIKKNSETSSLSSKIIPESLFVSQISQYDAFLNRLLRILFEIRPEYINNSERELSFSQLVEFSSIEAAREYVVEKEIDTILRKSHSDHFDYLEKKLGIPLRKNLPIWNKFIEITERRNLFVHCDGVVSNQYLNVCNANDCLDPDIILDKRLEISPKYYNEAYACLYEISTKLTHTIWRKLCKEDLKNADRKLNEISIELINNRQLKLADIILDFGCKQNLHFNDAFKNVFTVNKALSKYLQDQKDEAKKIVESKDWSASSDDFKLANLVLVEDFESVYTLMDKIGDNGEVDKESYKTWPLFSHLRKEAKFKEKYKEIFNEDYSILDIPNKPIQDFIEDFIKKSPDIKQKMKEKELSRKQLKLKQEKADEEE